MRGHEGTRDVSLEPHVALLASRQSRGWSRRRAAVEVKRAAARQGVSMPEPESIEKSISRHEKGHVRPDTLYVRLYCAIYGLSEQQICGSLTSTDVSGTCRIRSHKFVMAQLPPDTARTLAEPGVPVEGAWFECRMLRVNSPYGPADLYVWPFGTVAFHLVESNAWDHVADLALWRVGSYPANMAWASEWLSRSASHDVEAAYALSAYWVESPMWSGADLTTAAHLLSVPKTLLNRTPCGSEEERAAGRMVERSLFEEGFRHPDVREFGVAGISVRAASWSGVAYSPVATDRALAEQDLVQCELAIQALWTYCDYLSQSEEQGRDPRIDVAYSWHFLRRARSRLNISRPQETGQHMSMRTALVDTSGVAQLLDNAIELMREG